MLLPILCALFALDKADRVFSMWFLSSLTLRGVDVSAVKPPRYWVAFFQDRQQCSCGQVEGYMRSFCGSGSFERMVVRSAAQRLESHRAAGHLIILLSASPLPITKPIAEHFVSRNQGRVSRRSQRYSCGQGAHVVCGSQCALGGSGQRFVRGQARNASLVGETKEVSAAHSNGLCHHAVGLILTQTVAANRRCSPC